MTFYNKRHEFYCGIDLHARRMYTCIVDATGKSPTTKAAFAKLEKRHGRGKALSILAARLDEPPIWF